VSQRFSAQHRYQEILRIFQRWPGIGHFAAKRLFQEGSSHKQFIAQLKRLQILFEEIAPCQRCCIPKVLTQDCLNCLEHDSFECILILGHATDAFILQSFQILKSYYFMALPGYISPQSSLHHTDRQLQHIVKTLQHKKYRHCLILFNQSIEARTTLWMLQQRCQSNIIWKDASFLTLDKDNISHFSDIEIRLYEQQLQHYLMQ
jgi:recombinational DNA repair protein RecR